MPIVSSKIKSISVQIDGRTYVTEIHVYDNGDEVEFTYLGEEKDDFNQVLKERAVALSKETKIDYERQKVDNLISSFDELKSSDFQLVKTAVDSKTPKGIVSDIDSIK